MSRVPVRFFSCFFLTYIIVSSFPSNAQNSVWNGAGNSKKNAVKKISDSKSKVQNFKDHVQNWGLDTSFNHTFLLGGKLNTDGWSGCMYFLKRKDYKTNSLWQISFSEIKHEKQTKQQGSNGGNAKLGNPTPYVYGKINNLYTLQIGWGKEKLLLPAVLDDNLSVSFRYCGGLSLAMLKPYYLDVIYEDNSSANPTSYLETQKYNREDSAQFLNPKHILGSATWTTGLKETEYVPGVYFETALAITPGKLKSFVQIITLGINGAIYHKPLPILADQIAYRWQASLFAGLAIGKRWK